MTGSIVKKDSVGPLSQMRKNEIRSFIRQGAEEQKRQGRLIFSVDATGSREAAWQMATKLQRDLFATATGLLAQCVYFGGGRGCRASAWCANGNALADFMAGVRCEVGWTEYEKVFQHVRGETDKYPIRAVVLVGDCCEEPRDKLVGYAQRLKEKRVKVFVFYEAQQAVVQQNETQAPSIKPQEVWDADATGTFQAIAVATEGVYATFDAGSAERLKQLLQGAARYAATGSAVALADLKKVAGL